VPKPELTLTQRSVLVLLMAEAREVPSAYLTNVRQYKLDSSVRDKLKNKGYITVRQEKRGRPVFVELTELGWAKAIAELGAAVPERERAGATGAALFAVLGRIRQLLDRENIAASEFFTAQSTPLDVEASVRKAYAEIAPAAGAWVTLANLRNRLPEFAKGDVDLALRRLNSAPDIQLVPESNQKTLSAAERAGAVRIGNEDKHLIAIGS
jgi:hypothetical protein